MRHDGSVTAPLPGRGWHALAGAAAGAAGVATSFAAAWALQATVSPVVAVADEVRDRTPGDVAVRLVHLVGHADKPLLVGGTVAVLLLLCAGIGRRARDRPVLADVAFLALAAVALLSVLDQPRHDVASVLSVVVGLVTWIVALRWLGAVLTPAPAAAPDPGLLGGPRRRFLAAGAGVLVVGGLARLGGRLAGRGRRAVEQARRLLRLPVTPGVRPAGAELGVAGIEPWRTRSGRFYRIDTTLVPPAIRPSEWRLRVHGMVEREIEIRYGDLVARDLTEAWLTLCCVSNEVGGDLIGNAWWSGVPVREILAEARVHPDADAVKQTSWDGWTCGTPLSVLTDDRNALLAIAMNGRPLPVEHGFPVRMVVPGLYGYVSATKWVVDLEVTRFDKFSAYWTDRGWSPRGPVKTQSRIDVPRGGARVPAGPVAIGGSAWAQHTGIAGVDVQVDGGPWQPAELGRVPNADTWVQWSVRVDLEPGSHEVRVRATDRSGYTQTAARSDVLPDGATGWDAVTFRVT
jgi:DMSO/TMAO reductase YedYZ molybdopterin-dependent catalytic subunit